MECPHGSEEGSRLAVNYVAGRLGTGEQGEFEQHLQACVTCRAVAAAQQDVWSALDEWPPVVVSPEFNQRLFERIAEQNESAWLSWLRWRSAVPVATACTVLMAAFFMKQTPPALSQPRVQIEQVEGALDDMELLSQVAVEAAPKQTPAGRL